MVILTLYDFQSIGTSDFCNYNSLFSEAVACKNGLYSDGKIVLATDCSLKPATNKLSLYIITGCAVYLKVRSSLFSITALFEKKHA